MSERVKSVRESEVNEWASGVCVGVKWMSERVKSVWRVKSEWVRVIWCVNRHEHTQACRQRIHATYRHMHGHIPHIKQNPYPSPPLLFYALSIDLFHLQGACRQRQEGCADGSGYSGLLGATWGYCSLPGHLIRTRLEYTSIQHPWGSSHWIRRMVIVHQRAP